MKLKKLINLIIFSLLNVALFVFIFLTVLHLHDRYEYRTTLVLIYNKSGKDLAVTSISGLDIGCRPRFDVNIHDYTSSARVDGYVDLFTQSAIRALNFGETLILRDGKYVCYYMGDLFLKDEEGNVYIYSDYISALLGPIEGVDDNRFLTANMELFNRNNIEKRNKYISSNC